MKNKRILRIVLRNFRDIFKLWSNLRKMMKNTDFDRFDKWRHIQKYLRKIHGNAGVRLNIHYANHRPTGEGNIIYANHQSLYDPIALIVNSAVPLSAVCKIELKDKIIVKDIIEATDSNYIDRNSLKQSLRTFNDIADKVSKGYNFVIFPEGTRSKNGNTMGEFHAAAFKCAIKSKATIHPVVLVDMYKALDANTKGEVETHLYYLAPIKYEEYQGMKSTEISELVKSRIQEILNIHSK